MIRTGPPEGGSRLIDILSRVQTAKDPLRRQANFSNGTLCSSTSVLKSRCSRFLFMPKFRARAGRSGYDMPPRKGCILSLAAFAIFLYLAARRSLHISFSKTNSLESTADNHYPIAENGTLSASGMFAYEVPTHIHLKGIGLFLHGCGHSATDFWKASRRCSECIGLPEELRLVRIAIRNGYVPLAVSSVNRGSKCWKSSTHGVGADYDVVENSLDELEAILAIKFGKKRSAFLTARVIVFGASSGGTFASTLPVSRLGNRVIGIICQIAQAVPVWRHQRPWPYSHPFPGTAFIHMGDRDVDTAIHVRTVRAELGQIRVPSLERSVAPRPFTESYCRASLPDICMHCPSLVDALRNNGHLDADFNLIKDPRESSWREAVRELSANFNDSLIADASPLSEVLNVAFARHEITSEFVSEAFSWIETQAVGNYSA